VVEVTGFFYFIVCGVAANCNLDCSAAVGIFAKFQLIAYPIYCIPSRNLASSKWNDILSNFEVLLLRREKRCPMKKGDMLELRITCCLFSTNPIHAKLS